jgi:hypothetical protein
MKRKTVTSLGVAVALVVLFIFYMYFLKLSCCHDYMGCDSSMRQIYYALHEYAEEHDRKYPEQLADLHPKYIDLRKARCTMCRARGDSLETGYHYIAGLGLDDDKPEPILFCKRYHLNGHGPSTYCAQFEVLLNGDAIVHVRDRDLRKYDGPMRRYFLFFRRYPYDGSKPTLELVRLLEPQFPDELRHSATIYTTDEDDEAEDEENPPETN